MNFCSSCGARLRHRTVQKQLTRSATNSKIAGVCGGIAEYLDADPTVVRLIWIILSVFPGGLVGGIVAYLLAWLIIPKASAFAPSSAGAAGVPTVPASR
jgi:phage shock protein PspC (stress-responsive transcriptional regulator)